MLLAADWRSVGRVQIGAPGLPCAHRVQVAVHVRALAPVPVLQGVAKPTASLWELLVSAEMLVAAGFDRYFELMNSPGALEIDQTEEHASILIPVPLNDHDFHEGGMPKDAESNDCS